MTTDDIRRLYDKIDSLKDEVGEINERNAMILAKLQMYEGRHMKLESQVDTIDRLHSDMGWKISAAIATGLGSLATAAATAFLKYGDK
ncbi:MAG: hypothetical protein HZB29_13930 [Nitrospinae bacterium]|nr:hypothetical protein [Nitrospinota bacterium]